MERDPLQILAPRRGLQDGGASQPVCDGLPTEPTDRPTELTSGASPDATTPTHSGNTQAAGALTRFAIKMSGLPNPFASGIRPTTTNPHFR